MPKNEGKGGKKRVKKLKLSERGKNENEHVKRELVFKEDGQEYAQVTKMLGQGRLEALCFDGVKRLCQIRGKLKVWIKQSDIVLIALREYQDEKADVVWRYSLDEARDLKACGEIPESAKINDAEMVSMSEKLVHTWLLEPHKPWLDLDPVTMLPLQPITQVGSNKYPSTEVGLRARQGLLLRQHRAHRGAGRGGRAATARQQADDASNNVRDPTAEQQQGFLIKEIRPLQDHTPRIELRQHAADDKLYYHVHGVVGLPLVLPASGLGPMEDPMQPGEQLLKVGHATSVRLQELSYEYTLEVAASSKKKEEDAATCPICLDGLGTNARVLMCKHKFHPACIDKWCRKREGDKKSCPNCRQVLWG